VKVQQVSKDLGVRYVLEGSVQKAGDKVRITAQLIDTTMGQHLWAEYYDRELKDIFTLQDEITIKIMSSLQVKLLWSREGEGRYLLKGTKNLEAFLKELKAFNYLQRGIKRETIAAARRLAEEAIALDPEYLEPYITIGWTHFLEAVSGMSKSPQESMGQAFKLAQKVLAKDESSLNAHHLLGTIYEVKGERKKAIAEYEKAIDLDPNHSNSYKHLANTLTSEGRPQEAVALLKKSMRLSPLSQRNTSGCLWRLGRAYRNMGQYDEALSASKKALNIKPNDIAIHLELAVTYIHLGREEEARAAATEILRISPKFSVKNMKYYWVYKNKADTERDIEALRKAGLK
jgi:adenylate cyclase